MVEEAFISRLPYWFISERRKRRKARTVSATTWRGAFSTAAGSHARRRPLARLSYDIENNSTALPGEQEWLLSFTALGRSGSVAEEVHREKIASSGPRRAAPCSLARAPYATRERLIDARHRRRRGSSVPSSPRYQLTVSAAVPSTSAVAVSNGGPSTRCGGLAASVSKKSFPAATAEAATSSVAASVPRLWVRAA